MTSETIEARFHEAMVDIYLSAKSECAYNAVRFLQMVSEQGGVQAAKNLLHALGFSDGLTALWEHRRLDLSMEALVLREPWCRLFSADELAVARKRLADLGYSP